MKVNHVSHLVLKVEVEAFHESLLKTANLCALMGVDITSI